MSFTPVHHIALRAGSNPWRSHKRAVKRTSSILFHSAWQTIKPVQVRNRTAPFTQKASTKILPSCKVTCAVFAASFTFLAITGANPLQLESPIPEDSDGERSVDLVNERYKPGVNNGLRVAEQILNWDSRSQPMQSGSNILRYDSVRIASNAGGGEDFTILASGRDEEELKWVIAGIFDGHAGSRTAETLQDHLTDYLVHHIYQVLPDDIGSFSEAQSTALDKAIKAAFVELDQDIMAEAAATLTEASFLDDAVVALEAAYAGSCSIVSYYNSDTKLLKVACTGDSRAVLGRRRSGSAGDWEAIALSEDQTGNNENETRRLHSEHPNEPEMIKDGRLLGLVVTRAFGDSRWKWPRELQEQARDRFFGPQLREGCQTPPYLTAEPVVTTTRIKPENGDFLIQASDGLWDEISSAQAVDLVGRWLKNHDPSKEATPLDLSDVLTPPKTEKRVNPAGKRSYQSLGRVQERDYVVRDENAAVHLARNALGGRDEDRLRGMLTAQPPLSRKMRDDITIQVIFFGDDPSAIINTDNL